MAKKDAAATAPETTTAMTAPEQNTALANYDYGDDIGRGYEGQTKADMAIPFINQLQALSPLVATEKAKSGDYLNTVTGEIYSRETGFLFVPGGSRRAYAEWVPRNNPDGSQKAPDASGGSGYRGEHAVDSEMVANALKASVKFGKLFTPDGNILRDTRYVYGCVISPSGSISMAIMPFWSTKIKPYQAWMTRMRQMTLQYNYEDQMKAIELQIAGGQGDRKALEDQLAGLRKVHGKTILGPDGKAARPPIYAHLTKFTSTQTQNTLKQMFYIPVIESADKRGLQWSLLPREDERFQMAKECKLLFESGEAKVDYSKQAPEEADEDHGDPFGS